MKLTVEYILLRHKYWKERIGKAGIWNAERFKPVEFIVYKRSKTYDGLFCRKWVKVNGRMELQDSIVMYQQYEDITKEEIDDTLVHEMIHQYIYQNGIKDSDIHGRVFREFMVGINEYFPNELNLKVSGELKERKGPGETLHKLLLVYQSNDVCHCCKVNPNKLDIFISLIEENKDKWKIKKYELCESYDRYFDSFSTCTRRLHGERMNENELAVLRKNVIIK